MDRDQHELQFLGFVDVYRESSKIIIKGGRSSLRSRTRSSSFSASSSLHSLRKDSPRYRDLCCMLKNFWLVELSSFISVFVFSLLSTSAVVYMGLVIVRQFSVGPALGIALAVILLILYVVGFVYITMICQLASVISVLEDAYGRKAMTKSKGLIKGKMDLRVWCFFGVLVCSVLVQALFGSLVALDAVPLGVKIGIELICMMLLSMLVLFNLIVQTMIYFVCKSYHHENIDSSCLSDHPKVYLGDRL
ncbi:uncharacterized protein LOC104420150 [Eucalyptus grandis]|uniref:uncharacterized protein LOC104420150 n=1 Tax=Eucalyptus grandis TaxID=71139 RepID=UPI00192F0397|nr:uncharacterized protein LOC104420150 [Eucalyptus grandis]